jgi:EmrB/QacA subfamily drug resistance transporter
MPRLRSGPLAIAATGLALFMVVLDNLVVLTALPEIRDDLGSSIGELEWFVNSYTLTFSVLLLLGAALGDRFGRRRVFVVGIGIFTVASAVAGLASTNSELIAARAVQGLGGALVMPLSLTLLTQAFPAGRRGMALGIWSAISGIAVALGPLVGGAVVDGISWHWIFWINVPVGIIAIPFALTALEESRGDARRLDVPGLVLASGGLVAVVWALVRANALGWTDLRIIGAFAVGAILLTGFLAWQARTAEPILPLGFFRSRAFSATNAVALVMSFGIFGSIFLLVQFLQTVQGYSAFDAGVRTLPWTIMPMFVAPVAGLLSDRIGGRPLMATGLALQSIAMGWIAYVTSVDVPYVELVVPFCLAGAGMGLVFAPVANSVMSSVRPEQVGQASGISNSFRELGGVLGVAVLAAVFGLRGSYATPQTYVDGLVPAVWVGAAVLAVGAAIALLVPGKVRAPAAPEEVRAGHEEPAFGRT